MSIALRFSVEIKQVSTEEYLYQGEPRQRENTERLFLAEVPVGMVHDVIREVLRLKECYDKE